MKFLVFILFSWTLISCSINTEQSIVTSQDHEALRYLKEVEWPKAYHQQDTLLLDRILGEDFQMVEANGNWSDKKAEMQWVRENASAPDSFYYEIKRLDIYDNGTAIIAGTGHVINDGAEMIYESSNVLVKRDGIWKAVLSHVSGIKNTEQ